MGRAAGPSLLVADEDRPAMISTQLRVSMSPISIILPVMNKQICRTSLFQKKCPQKNRNSEY